MGEKVFLEYNPVLMKCKLQEQITQKSHTARTQNCPIKGCYSCNLKKLSNHLIQVHAIDDAVKRKRLLQKAKRVSI